MPQIITVKKGYPFTFCLTKSKIPTNSRTAVLFVFEIFDSYISKIRLYNIVSIISRAIINND